jgi:hypothetical protein
MKNILITISIFSLIVFAIGCRKDQIFPPPPGIPIPCASKLELIPIIDTCFEILPYYNNNGSVNLYYGQKYGYYYPFFNPATYEQFLFLGSDKTHPVTHPLRGADFCKGEVWTIHDSIQFSSSLYRTPKWSEKGWIIAVRWIDGGSGLPGERGLYKIKPNGDSLTFLLNQNVVFPAWVNSGDSIIFGISGISQQSFLISENGNMLDTIPHTISYTSSFKSKIAARKLLPGKVDIVVLQNGEIIWSHPYTEDFNNFKGLDWLNEEEIVWINDSGIFRANILNSQIELIKEVCPNIDYISVSAARDGSNRLLLGRKEYLLENGITDSMSLRYNISLYEIDTGKEYYVKVGEM